MIASEMREIAVEHFDLEIPLGVIAARTKVHPGVLAYYLYVCQWWDDELDYLQYRREDEKGPTGKHR